MACLPGLGSQSRGQLGCQGRKQQCCQGCLESGTILSANSHLVWLSLAKGIISPFYGKAPLALVGGKCPLAVFLIVWRHRLCFPLRYKKKVLRTVVTDTSPQLDPLPFASSFQSVQQCSCLSQCESIFIAGFYEAQYQMPD